MILASNSKRRQEILRDMGFNFKVLTSDIEEISDKEEISEMILDIAEKKLDKIEFLENLKVEKRQKAF